MNKLKIIIYGLISAIILPSCSSSDGKGALPATINTYPVIELVPATANTYSDYPAAVEGIQNIEIRPKIDGYIDAIYVDEGALVKKGQLLFRINAPQYEQEIKTAQANIKIALADLNAARMQVNKVRPLVEADIVSPYQLESAQYAFESKQGLLAQARAALSNAKTNLSYTVIYSPVDGTIGVLPYKIGSLVSSTTTNPLTTVSNISQIYAYFSINERQGLDFFLAAKGATTKQKLATLPPVTLILANGKELLRTGKVETVSGLIDAQTGAINMRATFSNQDGLVRSGSSAVVRIPKTIDSALLVPQKATYQIQGKLFVYVLNANNTVRSVEIETNSSSGQYYIVQNGLKAGDKIVADGIQNLREGLQIKPDLIKDIAN